MSNELIRGNLGKILRKHRRKKMMLRDAVYEIERLFESEEENTQRILEAIHSLDPWHKVEDGLPEEGYYRVMMDGIESHAYFDGDNWRESKRNIALVYIDLVTHYQSITAPGE